MHFPLLLLCHQIMTTKPNSPHLIRTSFLTYLQHLFPYNEPWTHPVTQVTYSHELIKRRLSEFKKITENDSRSLNDYRALWYLWSRQNSRSSIAESLFISSSTLRRSWDRSIDTILLMLLFPDLVPEVFVLPSPFWETP